jgi:hypothetical protein
MTAALMRFALGRSSAAQRNVTGRVSGRHACLPKTHDTLESAKKTTVVTAFSNPFHDLYKAEIARQLQEHYSKAESDIRRTLTSEFFLKKELSWILFQIFAVLITAVFLLSRMPWDKVWNAVKCIFHL